MRQTSYLSLTLDRKDWSSFSNDIEDSDAADLSSTATDAGSQLSTNITSIDSDSDSEDGSFPHSRPIVLVPPSFRAAELKEKLPVLPPQYPRMPDGYLETPCKVSEEDENTPDAWLKRDERLIRLTGKHPFNCEAPLETLFDAGFLTPASLFYVRNHGPVPRVSIDEGHHWKIEISGLVKRPMILSLAELQTGLGGRLPVVTAPVTLVCAGNRRREQNVVRRSLGFNWGAAGLSTALFTGVYLADLLRYVGITKGKRGEIARHVVFEGGDALPNGPYGTSQRLGWARERSKGMMIAWRMNGLPLEPDHGYPVRLVVPGQIGGRSVKWLKKIEVSEQESQHHLHFWDNKLLPTQVMPEEARKERHWWYDPKYIINDLNVNSAIAHPAHGETLDVTPPEETSDPEGTFPAPTYAVQGYAYAGGGRRVCRVELSLDEGATWKLAEIVYPEDVYRAYSVDKMPIWGTIDSSEKDTCFCWCFWKIEVELQLLSTDGVRAIIVRAMDESLALQPSDMYWNATGMMNNWWFRVAIHRFQEDRRSLLKFEHPTIAGVKEGGWMQRMKDEFGLASVLSPTFGAKVSTRRAETGKNTDKMEDIKMTKDGIKRLVTLEDLQVHKAESDPWFVVNGEVYAGATFLEKHPGGPDSITLVAGEDASDDFLAIHSPDAKKQLADFHIGTLERAQGPEITQQEPDAVFLSKTRWKRAKLISISHVSPDTRIFKFALQSPDQMLGLPTGQHIFARLSRNGKGVKSNSEGDLVQRAYTPISSREARGFIELLIKIYFPSPQFPLGGCMTGSLAELKIGDSIELKGPLGSFMWKGDGKFSWRGRERQSRTLGFVCGGSGITPIIQVIRAVLEDETDSDTKLWLIDANRTEKDILLYDELQQWKKMRGERFQVHHVLSGAPPDFDGSKGYVRERHFRDNFPPPGGDAVVLICGPPGLIESTAKPHLIKCGWDLEKTLIVF